MAVKTDMSPSVRSQWLHRLLLLGAFIGVFFGFRLLWNSYEAYRDKRASAERARDAQEFLEVSNPARRRAGLWPITAAFSERTYTEDYNSPGVTAVKLSRTDQGYRPRPMVKVVGYNSKSRQLLWEKETINFTVLSDNDSSEYALHRTYSYQAAQATAQGRNPWKVGFWTVDLTRSTVHAEQRFLLRPAQADSVLRDWRARGVRDSLAAVKSRVSSGAVIIPKFGFNQPAARRR